MFFGNPNYLPRFSVFGTALGLSGTEFFSLSFDDGLRARDGRKTLSASESASPSLPEVTFSGPEVSAKRRIKLTLCHRK